MVLVWGGPIHNHRRAHTYGRAFPRKSWLPFIDKNIKGHIRNVGKNLQNLKLNFIFSFKKLAIMLAGLKIEP